MNLAEQKLKCLDAVTKHMKSTNIFAHKEDKIKPHTKREKTIHNLSFAEGYNAAKASLMETTYQDGYKRGKEDAMKQIRNERITATINLLETAAAFQENITRMVMSLEKQII